MWLLRYSPKRLPSASKTTTELKNELLPRSKKLIGRTCAAVKAHCLGCFVGPQQATTGSCVLQLVVSARSRRSARVVTYIRFPCVHQQRYKTAYNTIALESLSWSAGAKHPKPRPAPIWYASEMRCALRCDHVQQPNVVYRGSTKGGVGAASGLVLTGKCKVQL